MKQKNIKKILTHIVQKTSHKKVRRTKKVKSLHIILILMICSALCSAQVMIETTTSTGYKHSWGSCNPSQALGLRGGSLSIPTERWERAADSARINLPSFVWDLLPDSLSLFDPEIRQTIVASGPTWGVSTTVRWESGLGIGFALEQPILKETPHGQRLTSWISALLKAGDPKKLAQHLIEVAAKDATSNGAFLPRVGLFCSYMQESDMGRSIIFYRYSVRSGIFVDGSRRYRLDGDIRQSLDDLIPGGPFEDLTDLVVDVIVPDLLEQLSLHPQIIYGQLGVSGELGIAPRDHVQLGVRASGEVHHNFSRGFSPVISFSGGIYVRVKI